MPGAPCRRVGPRGGANSGLERRGWLYKVNSKHAAGTKVGACLSRAARNTTAPHTLTGRNADTPTSKSALVKSRVPATMSEFTTSSLVEELIQQARSLEAVQEAASVCPWVVLTALAGRANRTIKSPMRHDPVPPVCWIVFVSHAHHVTPGWRTALFDPFPQDPIRSSNVIRILPPLILGVPTVVIDSVHVGARCVSLPHLTRRFTAQPLPLSAPLPSLLLPKFPKCLPSRLEPERRRRVFALLSLLLKPWPQVVLAGSDGGATWQSAQMG